MKYPEDSKSAVKMPQSEDILRNYTDLSEIGQGVSGVVFKARDLSNDGKFVAIKKFKVHLSDDGGVPPNMIREVATLRQLAERNHPNVIKLLDVCNGPQLEREKQLVLYVVFEHVEMDLAEYMSKCPLPGVPFDRICHLMRQLFSGVDFLHFNRVIHRDLKPQNLLITSNGDLKIADFGLAKTFTARAPLTSVVATLWYRSPEVLLGGPYATPLDIWSCGCIMAELFRGSPIFPGESEIDQLKRILSIIGTPSETEWPADSEIQLKFFGHLPQRNIKEVVSDISDEAADLLQSILLFSSSYRISAKDALQHPYFKDEQSSSCHDGIGPDK